MLFASGGYFSIANVESVALIIRLPYLIEGGFCSC
jgi:hypothetical protein